MRLQPSRVLDTDTSMIENWGPRSKRRPPMWRRSHTSRVVLTLAAALLAGRFTACGGDGTGPTVVSVGGLAIGQHSVEHWTSVIARGAVVANVFGSQQSPRQQALTLLVNSDWLIAEALRSGLRLSKRQLARIVAAQKQATPNGPGEFHSMLAATGETQADVEFEATARWAASALARKLADTAEERARAEVTPAIVARFYRRHIAAYHRRERRFYDLHEYIPTRARALALKKKLGSRQRFAEGANKEKPFRPTSFKNLPGQAVAYRAVFAAKVGVLTGPLPLQGQWCLFVIRRIEPARLQPLSEVRGAIEAKLLAQARTRTRTALIAAYRARWTARTDCRPGYVVQKCRQYTGRRKPEGEPFAGY
jgi:hypothetical protein